MSGETTCPTCGGPAEAYLKPFKSIHSYRTTADPARLARLESLLREIAKEYYLRDYFRDAIAALLGPADAS